MARRAEIRRLTTYFVYTNLLDAVSLKIEERENKYPRVQRCVQHFVQDNLEDILQETLRLEVLEEFWGVWRCSEEFSGVLRGFERF